MTGWKFSLRSVFTAVTVAAVCATSLAYASYYWSVALTVAWNLFLVCSTFAAIYRLGQGRAFWLGCCLLGWWYVVSLPIAAHVQGFPCPRRIAGVALDWAYESIKHEVPTDQQTADACARAGAVCHGKSGGIFVVEFPFALPFYDAGDAWAGLATSLFGGLIARWFYLTRDRVPARSPPDRPRTDG